MLTRMYQWEDSTYEYELIFISYGAITVSQFSILHFFFLKPEDDSPAFSTNLTISNQLIEDFLKAFRIVIFS